MSDLEGICDMTESLDFTQGGSRLSIPYDSPDKKTTHKIIKCFKCAAKTPSVQNCPECKGRGHISEMHPMCLLLNDIIATKLPHFYPNTSLSLKDICPISQQSSVVDEKIKLCYNCKDQCDANQYSICLECKNFYICIQCQKSARHQHVLIKFNRIERKNEMKCECCKILLENLCLKCRDCENKGRVYLICEQCNRTKRQHPHNSFCPILIKDNQGRLGNLSQFGSEEAISEMGQDYFQTDNLSNAQIQKQARGSARATKNTQVSHQQPKGIQQSQIMIDCSMIMSECGYPEPPLNFRKAESQILSDSDEQAQSQKEVQQKVEDIQKSNQYVFENYACDICKINPIKKVRYHCERCPDYDLCQKCFNKNGKQHQHPFKLIDGQELVTKKKQFLRSAALKFLSKTTNKNIY